MKTMKTMKTMKFLKPFYLLLIFSVIFSCSSDDSEPEQELNLSDLTLTISNVELTTAKVRYSGSYSGDNPQILYKKKNSTDTYQSITSNSNDFVLSGLNKATEYEVKFEVSNNSTNLQSDSYFFTTKAVNFDYSKFYTFSESGEYSSPYLIFSHLNKEHVIHAEGLSDYDDVKVFLVNEQKTDSLEINSTVESDALTFSIPENYLSQTPRESVKKAWVGIKINDSYEYLLNDYAWVNVNSNPNYSPEDDSNEAYLKLKIFNDKPYIENINISTGNSSTCPNYTNISFLGEFFGVWDYYYWTPKRAELVIFDSNGNIYNSFTYIYGTSSDNCDYFKIPISTTILDEGLELYHQRNTAQTKISNLPLGNYSAKIVFTFENITESVETNTFNFTKE